MVAPQSGLEATAVAQEGRIALRRHRNRETLRGVGGRTRTSRRGKTHGGVRRGWERTRHCVTWDTWVIALADDLAVRDQWTAEGKRVAAATVISNRRVETASRRCPAAAVVHR